MTKLIIGLVLCTTALFLGSYILHSLGMEHWANFPTFMTACFSFFGGIALFSKGLTEVLTR